MNEAAHIAAARAARARIAAAFRRAAPPANAATGHDADGAAEIAHALWCRARVRALLAA